MLHDLRTFGGLLADLRERRGLSAAQLAKRAGWYAASVHGYEMGVEKPSAAVVADLVRALALDADDTGRLYVAAGLLPPGEWCWVDGWLIRGTKEETTNAVQPE
jgi:transcriptional regulator with XRE-family HTH domain